MPNPYPAESRERGLWMLADARADQPSDYTLAGRVAGRLGVNPETCGCGRARRYRCRPTARDAAGGALGARAVEETDRRCGFRHRRRIPGCEDPPGVGRDQTGRVMRSLGLRRVGRSKTVFITTSDFAGLCPADLVRRLFYRRGRPARRGGELASDLSHRSGCNGIRRWHRAHRAAAPAVRRPTVRQPVRDSDYPRNRRRLSSE